MAPKQQQITSNACTIRCLIYRGLCLVGFIVIYSVKKRRH